MSKSETETFAELARELGAGIDNTDQTIEFWAGRLRHILAPRLFQAARQIASGNEALHALGLPPNNAAQTLRMLTSILGQPQNEPHDPTRHSELRTGKATGINWGQPGGKR